MSHKYSQGNAYSVCKDLSENHNRFIAKSTVQNITDWVGSIACSQEEKWDYELPELNEPISTIVFSLDGAYILMANEGYREAMVGNLSLYDCNQARHATSRNFGTPVAIIHSPTQRMGDALAALRPSQLRTKPCSVKTTSMAGRLFGMQFFASLARC